MKDVSLPLRTKYYELLNGNVTLNGIIVPVFDVTANQQAYPFIILDVLTGLPEEDKDLFGSEIIFTIDIVTGYSVGGGGGRKDSDLIAGQVKNLIKPSKIQNVFDLEPNFTNIVTTFERENTIIEQTETNLIIRRVLEFKHIIQEN